MWSSTSLLTVTSMLLELIGPFSPLFSHLSLSFFLICTALSLYLALHSKQMTQLLIFGAKPQVYSTKIICYYTDITNYMCFFLFKGRHFDIIAEKGARVELITSITAALHLAVSVPWPRCCACWFINIRLHLCFTCYNKVKKTYQTHW